MATLSNYTLRLLASLKTEAEKVVEEEGTTLNQFINVAVAEKLAALRTARYFQEHATRADLETFDRLLGTAGVMSHRAVWMRYCQQKIDVRMQNLYRKGTSQLIYSVKE